MELLVVFFVALGVGMILWCLFGLLLMPVYGPEMVTLCFAKGDGLFLEHRVRAYNWLRDSRSDGGRLVIVDRGLTDRGRKLARCLSRDHDWVTIYEGELPAFLEESFEIRL